MTLKSEINTIVSRIRSAIYGEEVRESIAHGIELIHGGVEEVSNQQTSLNTQFNNLVINAGSSNAEIVQARVDKDGYSYPSLKARLDTEVTSQLKHSYLVSELLSNRSSVLEGGSGGIANVQSIQGSTLKNLVINGNFTNTNSWTCVQSGDFTVANNTAQFKSWKTWGRLENTITLVKGHSYYISALVKSNSKQVSLNVGGDKGIVYHSGNNEFEHLSNTFTATESSDSTIRITDTSTDTWSFISIKEVMCVDLTHMYGSVHTKAWCDSNIMYFDGIKSAGEEDGNKLTISSLGKNVLKLTDTTTKNINGLTYSISNNTLSITGNATSSTTIIVAGAIYTNPGKYTFSKDVIAGGYSGGVVIITDSPMATTFNINLDEAPKTFTTKYAKTSDIKIWIQSGVTFNNYKVRLQLEIGDIATPYADYRLSEVQVPYSLRGLSNKVTDEVVNNSIITRIGKVTLTGTESWAAASTSEKDHIYTIISGGKPGAKQSLITSHFNSTTDFWTNAPHGSVQTSSIEVCQVGFTFNIGTYTVESFKAFLKTNPITVYYELATPVTTSIRAIDSLQTYQEGSIQIKNTIVPQMYLKHPGNIAGRVTELEDTSFEHTKLISNLNTTTYKKAEWKTYVKDGFNVVEFPNGLIYMSGTVPSVVGKGYAQVPLQNYMSQIFSLNPYIKYGDGGSEENGVIVSSVQIMPNANSNIYIRLLNGESPTQARTICFESWGIKK